MRRVAFGFFVLILAAAIAGVFGDGPLARTRVESGEVTLEYDRFVRGEATLAVRYRSDAPVRVVLRGVCDPADEIRCVPAASTESARNSERELVFPPDPARTTIEVCWKPRRAGVRRGSCTIDGTLLEIWTLIYP